MNGAPVLIIGSGSFIGKALASHAGTTTAAHDDPQLSALIEKSETIVNCAFNPALRTEPYQSDLDFDTAIARQIQGSDKRLYILSSRTVYGPTELPASEDITPNPQTPYALNKFIAEQACTDLLGTNLGILRLSNAFGFEYPSTPSRRTFMSQLLSSLLNDHQITFDISGKSEKDFLPVTNAALIIHHLILHGHTGIYNVGAGQSLSIEQIAASVLTGFGQGQILYTDTRLDTFHLSTKKLEKAGYTPPTGPEILKEFETIGRKLATTGVHK